MAAGLGTDVNLRSNDIRGLAAVDYANIRRAAARRLFDFSQPALAVQIGNCQRSDRDRADAPFRPYAGMTGRTRNRNRKAIAAGGPDGDLVRRSAVEVESQLWPAEHADRAIPGAVEPDFLLHGPEECQRPVFRFFGQNVQGGCQDRGRAGTVIGAQSRLLVGWDDVFSLLDGLLRRGKWAPYPRGPSAVFAAPVGCPAV